MSFTQSHLDAMHSKWRKILRMEHMKGEAKLVGRVDKAGSLGSCTVQHSINWYRIRILSPDAVRLRKKSDVDIEASLVHELLHAKRWWEFLEDDPIKSELDEKDIEETSQIMVELHRRAL